MTDPVQGIEAEARARIQWGDATEDVRQWLETKHLPSREVDRILSEAYRERDTLIRQAGLRDIVVGTVSLVAGLNVLLLQVLGGLYMGRLMLLVVLPAIYGPVKIMTGLGKVLSGGKTRGSVSAIDNG